MLLERIQYSPPWKATNWGFGFWPVNQGGDEWGNPSIYFVLPLLGTLVTFYGRNFKRDKWFLQGSNGTTVYYISPDYQYEAHLFYNGNFENLEKEQPLLSDEEIRIKASYVEKIDYYN